MPENQVIFKRGESLSAYNSLQTKDANTLYFVLDPAEGNHLFLGEKEVTDPTDLESALTRIQSLETDSGNLKSILQGFLTSPTADAVKTYIDGIKTTIEGEIGTLASLTTDAKTTVVAAINEVDAAVDAAKTASTITVTSANDSAFLKKYTISQGGVPVGVTIDIPKDMVVNGGSVIKASSVPGGIQVGDEGEPVTDDTKFLRLDIANQEEPVYIPVADLVDAYTAQASASEIQLAISDTNEISASVVNGSIALEKLSSTVQASLAKADSAVQNVATGTTPGTISVTTGGSPAQDVAVNGLKKVATSGLSEDITYSEETTVKDALDDLYLSIGEGGSVLTQIAEAIGELDSSTTATAGSVLTGVTIADGKITEKTEVALTAENTKYGESSTVDAELDKILGGTEVVGSIAKQVNDAKTSIVGTSGDTSATLTLNGLKKYTDETVSANAMVWSTIE